MNNKILNINNIIDDLNSKGFFESENLINANDLNNLRSLVNQKIKQIGNQNFWLNSSNLENTYIFNKEFDKKLRNLVINITEIFKFPEIENQDLYKILRVITGNKQKNESHKYHFDAHFLTVLIPIFIPKREDSGNGDLIIFPNIRKVTNNIFINIFQKIFFQNQFTRFFLKTPFFKKILNFQRLRLEPGKIYIFYGFRTLHGNLDINAEDLRATLLIHFYDIFKNSKLVKLNRNMRILKEKRNIVKK